MVQRGMFSFLVVLLIVPVALLVFLGYDLRRSAQQGPQWKRRLVAACLVILGLLGFGGCTGSSNGNEDGGDRPDVVDGDSNSGELHENAAWKRIAETWREAASVADGSRGDYPFDREGKTKLLDNLARAKEDVKALLTKGLVSEAEAGLLVADLDLLIEGVGSKRSTDAMNVLCYETVWVDPSKESLGRVQARLPLLDKLAATGDLDPEVLTKVLATVVRDIETLRNPAKLQHLSPEDRAKAEETAEKALEVCRRIARDMGKELPVLEPLGIEIPSPHSDQLGQREEWQQITATWHEAAEVAGGKHGDYPFNREGKERLLERLNRAKENVQVLAEQSLLTEPEAGLLGADLDLLIAGVQSVRPTEAINVTCYMIAVPDPAEQSLDRLTLRLPLLEKMAGARRVKPAVVERVIETVHKEIEQLSTPEALTRLSDDERERAKRLATQARQLCDEIERRVHEERSPAVTCYDTAQMESSE